MNPCIHQQIVSLHFGKPRAGADVYVGIQIGNLHDQLYATSRDTQATELMPPANGTKKFSKKLNKVPVRSSLYLWLFGWWVGKQKGRCLFVKFAVRLVE